LLTSLAVQLAHKSVDVVIVVIINTVVQHLTHNPKIRVQTPPLAPRKSKLCLESSWGAATIGRLISGRITTSCRGSWPGGGSCLPAATSRRRGSPVCRGRWACSSPHTRRGCSWRRRGWPGSPAASCSDILALQCAEKNRRSPWCRFHKRFTRL